MELINEELKKVFKNYPLYSQDGKGQKATVIVKYFFPLSNATWIITEAEEVRTETGGSLGISASQIGNGDMSCYQNYKVITIKVYSPSRETCI